MQYTNGGKTRMNSLAFAAVVEKIKSGMEAIAVLHVPIH